MSNLRYIAPIYDRLGGRGAIPVAFGMYAVGGRTQGIGVRATWWTTQGAQSQIDWAITEGFSPPDPSEYQTTPWTEDFVNNHDIPFPEVRMNQFHWFYARSRNAAGQVLQSPRRGIYVVPSTFEIESLLFVDYDVIQQTDDLLFVAPAVSTIHTAPNIWTKLASLNATAMFGGTTPYSFDGTVSVKTEETLKAEAKIET